MNVEVTIDPRQRSRRWSPFRRNTVPVVLAIFAFRYDAALVPGLIANIRPFVDGWVSLDDRNATGPYSSDRERRLPLLEAAISHGADWVLAVDPDERFEDGLCERIGTLTAVNEPTVWGFHLREMYGADRYRVDGVWGKKVQHRLFNLPRGRAHTLADFAVRDLHATWHPTGHRLRNSGLNLYHLKMIDPRRRVARRDLYATLDPERRYQRIGYDYLADDDGALFHTVPKRRAYHPVHHDDGGLWMPEPAQLSVWATRPPAQGTGDAL
jgi:hypothetical protein